MYNVILFTEITDYPGTNPITIGAYKLAHVLRKHGYSCLVVNHFSFFTEEDFDRLIDKAIGDQTVLVGFSTTFLHDNSFFLKDNNLSDKIVKKIKLKNDKIKFVVGGTQSGPNYNNKNIDYACLGYSETSIINLVNHLIKKTPLVNATKNIWGTTIIDDRFAPSYDFKNEDMVWLPEDVVNHKVLPIEIARGCIFKCKFCSYPMNGKQQLDFVKNEDNIRRELIDNHKKYGITHYYLIDDTFNDHVSKLETMLRIVKGLNFQPIFWGYFRLDLICTRPETLAMLYEIGVRAMFFGIETLNPTTAKLIGKGYNITKQIDMIKHIKSTYPDISVHGNFMVGLPEESIDSIKETSKLLINREIPLDSWYFQAVRLFKPFYQTYSSDLEKNYIEYGYEDTSEASEKTMSWKNKYMTEEQAKQLIVQISNDESKNPPNIEGRRALGMFDLTNNEYTFDQIRNIKISKFNFSHFTNTIYPNFISTYKETLFKIINAHFEGSGSESDD